MIDEDNDYSALYDLPHPTSKKHPRMPRSQRAAQFSPFAALTGYEAAIENEGRQTFERRELSEESKEKINGLLTYLYEHRKEKIQVRILFFVKDEIKQGGSYQEVISYIKQFDEIHHMLLLANEKKIAIEDILEMAIEE